MEMFRGFWASGRPPGNCAGFCRYIALGLIEQEILGDVGSGDEVGGTGSGDTHIVDFESDGFADSQASAC